MNAFNGKCKIEKNEQLGRYVNAAAILKEGETLLLEQPVLILPSFDEKRCANCFKYTDTFCSTCKIFPLCKDCRQHNAFDCEFFSAYKPDDENALAGLQQNAAAIYGILKCLLLRENPETAKFYEEFIQLEAHMAERRDSEIWLEDQKKIVEPLIDSGALGYINQKCTRKLEAETLQQWCGIIDVNNFEIRAPDVASMRGVYLHAALLSHSCLANTIIAIDDHHQLKMYTNRCVNQGEILSYCYTNVLLGTSERRELLRVGKYFDCKCERCEDPTELGSHMSSLICSPCAANKSKGAVVKTREGKWQCTECQDTLRPEFVQNIIDRAREEIFHAKDDVFRFELLLGKLSSFLHPNHYLMLDMKQNVAAMLRAIIMSPDKQPGRRVYNRKVSLCQEILGVLNYIEPGLSRLRAIALYELCNSWAELSRLKFREDEIDEEELFKTLLQCESMLRESTRMLLYEPIESPEGKLAKNMLKELRDLQNDLSLLKQSKSQGPIGGQKK